MAPTEDPENIIMPDERMYIPRLLLSLACYVVAAGTQFAGTVTLDQVRREFGVTVGEVSAVVGTLTLLRPLMLVAAGPAIDILGPTVVICSTLVLLGGFCIAMYTDFVQSIWAYYVLRGFAFAANAFADQPTHICLMGSYFREWLPAAASTINAGYSIAGATFPVTLAPVAAAFGWRAAWLCVGVLCVALALVGWLLLKPGPLPIGSKPGEPMQEQRGGTRTGHSAAASAVPPPPQPPPTVTLATGMPLASALRTLTFWSLLLAAFCVMFWEGTITNHLILMLTLDAGLSLTRASALYSLQYVCAICGKLSVGLLVRIAPRRMLFALPPLVFCLSHLLLFEPPGGWLRCEWQLLLTWPWTEMMGAHTADAAEAVANGPQKALHAGWARNFAITTSTPRLLAFAATCKSTLHRDTASRACAHSYIPRSRFASLSRRLSFFRSLGLLPPLLLSTSPPLALAAAMCTYGGADGLSFGLTHSLLTVQPAHLFGRRHLPYFQTILMATYVVGVSAGQVASGWAYDAGGEAYGPALMLTFAVSAANVIFCHLVGGARGWEDDESRRAVPLV